jgi:hypothetical protein
MVLAAVFVACAATAAAQSEQGRLTGTVRDESNAFVGGAAVVVKNDRTSETRLAETDAQGKFFVGSLKPSMYTIKVGKPGFAPVEYSAMSIGAGRRERPRRAHHRQPEQRGVQSAGRPVGPNRERVQVRI